MKTNLMELMSGLFKDATPIQKVGFASFGAGKLLCLVAMVWVVGPVVGTWFGVPAGVVGVSNTTLGGAITLYGFFIWAAVGIAIYDHYVNRLQKSHWEVMNEQV